MPTKNASGATIANPSDASKALISILIDTNVLVYAHDGTDTARQAQAVAVLQHLELTASGRLSVQCLSEFFSVATRKLAPPLTAKEAVEQIERLARVYPVLDLTTPIVLEAGRGVRDHQLAYYRAIVGNRQTQPDPRGIQRRFQLGFVA